MLESQAKLDSRKLLKRVGAPAVCLLLRVHTHLMEVSSSNHTGENRMEADGDAICLSNQTAIDACKNGLTLG